MLKGASFLVMAMILTRAQAATGPAAGGVTVNQLDDLLARLHKANDKSTAREIAGLQLTERVSAERLARWQADPHGERTRAALLALADAAAFLPPPATEIPATAAPDMPAQDEILTRTIAYVKETFPKLPDFLALRTTTAFEVTTEPFLHSQESTWMPLQGTRGKHSTAQALGPAKASGLPDGQLFWTGSTDQVITYRGGKEEVEAEPGNSEAGKPFFSLTTTGEFGPILKVILTEAPRENIVWDHWERRAGATMAVFHYSVPHDRSHFGFAFTRDQVPEFPAYHGEIAVEPASGRVLRITLLTRAHDPAANHDAAILVEFGPAQIGGITYTVPVHGVAMANSFDAYANQDAEPMLAAYQTSINDIAFTNYHVFRTKSRIVTGGGGP
jgi:hypothetical protein